MGKFANRIVLFNFPKDTYTFFILNACAKISYSFALILTYPLKFFPLIIIVENIQFIKNFITIPQGEVTW